MTNLPKGGRGHRAPYETCTVRIPVAIREQVEDLAARYRTSVIEGTEFNPRTATPELDEVIVIARKFLRQKRSTKHTIIKLLQLIYNTEMTEKDLE